MFGNGQTRADLMTPGEQVKAWLQAEGRKGVWLAKQCKVNNSTLHRWLVGESTPHPLAQTQIERITGIPASEWAKS
jgi:hypothetical protein